MNSKYNKILFLLLGAILLMVHSSWAIEMEHLGQKYEAAFPIQPDEIELQNNALELNAREKGAQYIVSAVPKSAAEAGKKLDQQFLAFHRMGAKQSGFWTFAEGRVYREEGIDKAHIVLEGKSSWVRHLLFVDLPEVGFVIEATLQTENGHEKAEEFLRSFRLLEK